MIKREEILLMKILSMNISIAPLREIGYTYSQIAMILQKLIKEGYVQVLDDVTQLTEKGTLVLNGYNTDNHLSGSSKWILPQEKYHQTPIKKNTIVLPENL
jgi:coproporphyrinogen III oxidase-like Fe-S oxidoreductase